jgi:putative two-component system response regulator
MRSKSSKPNGAGPRRVRKKTTPSTKLEVTQDRLESARSQLLVYAQDLKQMLANEEKKTQQLKQAHAQLLTYAKDLKVALDVEQHKNNELEQAYTDTMLRLARASRYKDEETGAHIERLSHYAQSMALFVGWNSSRAQGLFAVAPMHDVGKIGVPDAVLGKNGPLTEEEWEAIKQHPLLGASLLSGSASPLLEMAKEVALTHHERWDGSGYPSGLKGAQIPITGRIVMLCDLYDALRSQRPYKSAFSHTKTLDIMLNGNERTKPTHFDPMLLEAFREMHPQFDEIYSTVKATADP